MGPHTFSLPAQFITRDVMSEQLTEETVQFSQGFTPAVDLCKSLYFAPINCAVSPVNRTILSVRTWSSSIPYWNGGINNLRFTFLKELLNACNRHTAYCCFSFSVQCCPTTTFCYKKTERTEKKSRGKLLKRPIRSFQLTVQLFTQFWAQANCTVKLKVYGPL